MPPFPPSPRAYFHRRNSVSSRTATVLLVGGMTVATVLSGCDGRDEPAHAGALRVATLLGEPSGTGFLTADAVRPFVFPRDHGAHPRFRQEWWYLTAALRDPATGDEYGVQFTLFRRALAADPGEGPWRSAQAFLGHFALTDVERERHVEAERFSRGHPRLAGVRTTPFAAWIEGWRLESMGASIWPVRLEASTEAFGADLFLRETRPPVFQGDRGLSTKGPGAGSYYYSVPRLAIEGTLRAGDREADVAGLGWFDREWSTSGLGAEQIGWDWFALQLDDGRSLMAYQIRRRDGERGAYDQGVLVSAEGNVRRLGVDDFSLSPERAWRDDAGTTWPIAWRIAVGDEVFIVDAAIEDQVMDTSIRYWEGLVRVSDPHARDIGRGYMELTGY